MQKYFLQVEEMQMLLLLRKWHLGLSQLTQNDSSILAALLLGNDAQIDAYALMEDTLEN